jgi:TrmH family RNA methyltransferase
MRREITGFSNPLLKEVRGLREKKYRKRAGLFLAEGLRIMTEAREAGFLPEMLFRVKDRDVHALEISLETEVLAAGGDVVETNAEIMAKLSGKDNAQALVGVYKDHPTALEDIDRGQSPIWLVAQAMRDPGNLGTMLRTGDAVFTQKVVQCRWDEFLVWLRAGEGQLVGTSLQTEIDYQAATYAAPCFILTGNEAQGLPDAYEAQCDVRVKMPMRGKADSLNAAVATAVMAYEVLNQFRTAPGQP